MSRLSESSNFIVSRCNDSAAYTGPEREWRNRIGRKICVTFVVVGDQKRTVTQVGEIVKADGIEVVSRAGNGVLFSFQESEVADVANWRGTILVRLK